jgi:hypothetical protein
MDVTFIGIIKETPSAMKVDGSGGGGEITIQVPEIHLPEFLKMSLLRKQLLRFEITVIED